MPEGESHISVFEIVSQQIIKALDKGDIPWNKPWVSVAPRNLVSKKEYRGINVWLLATEGYTSPWWMSFKQVGQLGGRVKKGEHGTIVVFWKTGVVKEQDKDTGEMKDRKTFLLRYYKVWNSEQCTGIEVPKEELREHKPIEEAEAIWKGYKNPPTLEHGGDQACYIPLADRVRMPPPEFFKSAEGYYHTLFHEAVHSTGAKTRLKRLDEGKAEHGWHEAYSREELVAEMGASFLSNMCGIATDDVKLNAAGYIQHWRDAIAKDNRLVVMAGSKAQKAVDWIIGKKADEE